jgi:hypothetical protein
MKRRKKYIKVVGVGDFGRFVFWESLSESNIQCRHKIINLLYPDPEDPPDWERWEIKEVEIMV